MVLLAYIRALVDVPHSRQKGELMCETLNIVCKNHWQLQATSNDRQSVSNYRSVECLFNRLLRLTEKEYQSITGPLWGESTIDRWAPSQRGQ